MIVPPPDREAWIAAKERLTFLMQHKIHKGRMKLLYQLYRSEIHSLSLVGAAKIITRDLGFTVGIQTIRTLRKKSGELRSPERTGWERSDGQSEDAVPPGRNQIPLVATNSSLRSLEGFKPLDVFSEEFQRQQSTIRWTNSQNA